MNYLMGGYNEDGIPATMAKLSSPDNVTFDGQGHMYIADTLNLSVRRIDKFTGLIDTVAGSGDRCFSGDCSVATSAKFLVSR